jgi:hypothetical protein
MGAACGQPPLEVVRNRLPVASASPCWLNVDTNIMCRSLAGWRCLRTGGRALLNILDPAREHRIGGHGAQSIRDEVKKGCLRLLHFENC